MLEDIRERGQAHTNVNRRESRYKISDLIKQIQSECKELLKATRKMGKGLYKVFKTVVKDILQYLLLGESGSEVSYFISEPRNFAEVTKLSGDINKPWLKEPQKDIKNLINNQTFLVEDPEEGETVTPCIDVTGQKLI